MGATNVSNSVRLKSLDKKEISTQFNEMIQNDRYENGHSYSGTIGMKNGYILKKNFPSKEGVREYIEDTIDDNDKWDPAFLVTYPEKDYFIGVFYGWVSE